MGVKDLWNILSPIGDRKPLHELQGKAVAIDLSCWVVDSQTVTDNMAQPKMYLRNLFFRTSYFLLHDIFPVFVLEGEAPTLKHKTIAKRNEIRHGANEKKNNKKGGRTRFNHVLKECEEMFKFMGLACVKGYGEAEAMCAYLNEDGLVDACITQDSDCFLYGAKVVYRNFCTSTQGTRTTSGGSVDEYSMKTIESAFKIGRNKMIALALLCGCDYDEGVNGVGKEAALKLFKITDDNNILERIKGWRTDPKFKRLEIELANPDVCTNCGHKGKMRVHTKSGCQECGTTSKCQDTYKEKRNLMSNELTIRKKALLTENFPNQDIINEFLIRKGSVPSKLDLKCGKPKIVQFIAFMEKKVLWEPSYAFAKIFPLMTRWQLVNVIEYPIEHRLTTPGTFVPEKIKKIRNIRSVPSYEILWLDKDNLLNGLTLVRPDSEKENDEEEDPATPTELVTIEPQNQVLNCYPSIVEEFEAERNAKKKKPTRSRKKKNEDDPAVEKKKPERKKRAKSKPVEVTNNHKILDYVKVQPREPTLEESLSKLDITPKRLKKDESEELPRVKKRGPQFDKVMTSERLDSILNGSLEVMFNELTPEDFASDIEDSISLSSIVDDIVSKKSSNQMIESDESEVDVSVCDSPTSDLVEMEFDGFRHKSQMNEDCRPLISDTQEVSEIHDEFDCLDTSYVPLHKRIDEKNRRGKGKTRKSSSPIDNSRNRFSIGIESLLNGTD